MFDSNLNPDQRAEDLVRLGKEHFDVLVIGGGINGVGVALDAATRGLSVALIEADDFASGTSSRSSKLIHGGLRYLEQYDFGLVREALNERELMVTSLAPHLVKPVPFLYPLQEKFKERTYVGAGMTLYDALRGFKRALPWHKHLSQKRIREIAPSLRLDVVTGGYQYFDAKVDDARHTMMIARTAAKYGAQIATRTVCTAVTKEGKRVTGVKARDLVTNEEFAIKSRVTIMAAGVWTDDLYRSFEIKPGYSVRMSKGAHIVVPGSAIKAETGVIIKTDVSVLFIIPWGDKWIVGTTDTDYQADPNSPMATREDVTYIINQANRVLEPKLDRSQVIGVFAGLRPLVSTDPDSPTTELSREHVVDHPVPGFVTIAGGKYTTYRVMAEDAVDSAVVDLKRIVPDSCTETLPVIGAEGYEVLRNKANEFATRMGMKVESINHLIDRYGSLFEEVLEISTGDRSLLNAIIPGLPYLKAEIIYSATHEGALSVSDVLSRRTRISFEDREQGLLVADEVATLIGNELGWSEIEREQSLSEYRAQIQLQNDQLASLVTEKVS